MRTALLALLLAASPALAGPNHVYVYGNPNRSMECAAGARFYVDTIGQGHLIAGGCETLWMDWTWWPDFPLLDIRVRVTGPEIKGISANCSFVSHANNGNNTTSTVIDCR